MSHSDEVMHPSSFTAVVSVEMQSIADPNMLEMGDVGSDVAARREGREGRACCC